MSSPETGKRKDPFSSSINGANKKKSCHVSNQLFAVDRLKTTKSPDQLLTIGQIVLRLTRQMDYASPENDIDTKDLRAVWNYSEESESDLEHAALRIVTTDNTLVFDKQVTQACDRNHSDIITQGVGDHNNNDNNHNSWSSNSGGGSSNIIDDSAQQKLFVHLARLCMNNFVITSNIILDTNYAIDKKSSLVTLTLAADTGRFVVLRQLFMWLIPYLYPTTPTHGLSDGPLPMDDFYRHLQPPISIIGRTGRIGHGLQSTLMPFQSQNVEWMLSQEGYSVLDDGTLQENTKSHDQLPYLWEKVAVTNTRLQHIYINRVTHSIFDFWSPELEWQRQKMYHGGILADEMGLGKTLSTIALILLHMSDNSKAYQRIDIPGTKRAGTTLIITPITIIHQWEAEFKRYAPGLRVVIYNGVKYIPDHMETEDMADMLASHDVVLTSYNVLKSEIYYSREVPERSRRRDTKVKIKRSPLVQILWWRCIVDEAQEVEGSVSLTAEMAGLIPRYYSWAVTGTPIKSTNYDDLYGLFRFLGYLDNLTLKQYRRLYTSLALRNLFMDFTKQVMRRNMKSLLRDQIHIPLQHRHVVKISFSAIEQQYYNDLRELTRHEANAEWLDSIGWSKPEDMSSPGFSKFVESTRSLRKWLYTLRETCVYPARTGKSRQDVQSLVQVLKIMIQTTSDKIDEAEIGMANDKLTCGGMYELIQEDWKLPLSVYLDWVPHVEAMVRVCSARLEEVKRLNRPDESNTWKPDDSKGSDVKTAQPLQTMLTTWQNILHRYYFYIAGVYHMLKENDKENEYYEMAADIRRQILVRPLEKVESSVKEIKNMDSKLEPRNLTVSFSPRKETLLLTDDFLTRMDGLTETLNSQMEVILTWRTVLKKILTSNLVDSNEGDVQGDEYIDSLIIQKKCYIYQDIYQDILRDRHYWLNGIWQTARATNNNDDNDITNDDTEDEELKRLREELEKVRQALSPKPGSSSMRLLVAELREIAVRSSGAHKVERHLLQQELTRLGREVKQQKDVQDFLETEYRKLSALSNNRIEYYRSLQHISDHVETWESPDPRRAIEKLEHQIKSYEYSIREQKSRRRYLEHLATEEQKSANGTNKDKEMFCLICNEYFTRGVVTHCGHVYCKVCAETWFKSSRRCPQCSATVKADERYSIFSSVATLQPDNTDKAYQSSGTTSSSGLSNNTLREIAHVSIEEGLGAKLDSIIRHIKYIQQKANGKCLVFSQWSRLLGILANGLESNDIGHVNLVAGKKDDSIEQFRSNPLINVMLLHSRSHSSGLTLLEAKTVFILEPVLNESLEKQAIGRVHRIGQTEETTVFWYIVRDTIEEKIQDIHNEKQRHRQIINDIELESTSKPILASKSDGGGEFVSDEDLRKCFSKLE